MFHLATLWAQQLNITRTQALDRILHHHTGVYVSPGGLGDAALPLLFHIFSWPTCSEFQFETEHVEMTLQSDRLCERLNAIFLSAKSVFFFFFKGLNSSCEIRHLNSRGFNAKAHFQGIVFSWMFAWTLKVASLRPFKWPFCSPPYPFFTLSL